MPNPVQTLRSFTPKARPPAGKVEGELYVNLPDKMIGMVDDTGKPVDLLRRKAQWGDGFYVDAAGDDANDGMSAATPWATLQRAADFFTNEYDLGIVGVYINVGVGTFVGPKFWNIVGGSPSGGYIEIRGAGVDQTIIAENNIGSALFAEQSGASIGVSNVTLRATMAVGGSNVELALIGPLALECAKIADLSEGYLRAKGAIELRQTGVGGGVAISLKSRSHFADQGTAWTLSGTPNTYSAWVALDEFSFFTAGAATAFTGSYIGPRYAGTHSSVFNSGGHGVNLFPGDQPGTLDATSSYDGLMGGHARRFLTAALDLYVETTGNDTTGDGTTAKPYATVAGAALYLRDEVDLNGQTVTIRVGAGTFDNFWVGGVVGNGWVMISGAGSALTTVAPQTGAYPVDVNSIENAHVSVNGVTLIPGASRPAISVFNVPHFIVGDGASSAPLDIVIDTINAPSGLLLMGGVPYAATREGPLIVRQNGVTWLADETRIDPESGEPRVATIFGIEISKETSFYNHADWQFTGLPDVITGQFFSAYTRASYSNQAWAGGGFTGALPTGKRFNVREYCAITAGGLNHFPGTVAGTWDATSLYDGVLGGNTRRVLAAGEIRYVEATGNDANDGLAVGTAWATLARVKQYVCEEIDFNGQTVNIYLGIGTFEGCGLRGMVGEGTLNLRGVGVDQTIIVQPVGGYEVLKVEQTRIWVILRSGMTIKPNAGAYGGIYAGGVTLSLNGPLAFDATVVLDGNMIASAAGAKVFMGTPIEVRQNGVVNPYAFIGVTEHSLFHDNVSVWTLTGTPNSYPEFMSVRDHSAYTHYGVCSYTGAVTGKKFAVNDLCYAKVPAALGIDYFPGDQPGTWDASCFYNGVQGVLTAYLDPNDAPPSRMNEPPPDLEVTPSAVAAPTPVAPPPRPLPRTPPARPHTPPPRR